MASTRRKTVSVYTDVSMRPKPKRSRASRIVRVFCGSSLILYGSIVVVVLLSGKQYLGAAGCAFLPLLGLALIFAKPKRRERKASRSYKYSSAGGGL